MRMNNLVKQTKIFIFVLLSSIFTLPAFALPAFPGAEGPGAEAVGGREGRVIEVTNLNKSGPGSLREALEASGHRTVVFKVAGTIDLDLEPIYIKEPYLTIAGQTAPEGGITLKGEGIQIRTHDVVVRYIKLRPGVKRDIESTDGMGMQGTGDLYRNIVDHCSMSWANDENSQIWSWSEDVAPHDITYSWNIISEGFDEHSCGFLAGSYDNTKDFKDVSLHHNLFANTSHRLPLIKIASAKMVNNLVYNWSHYATGIKGGAHMDIIANKYKAGPETSSSKNQEVTVEDSGYGDPTYPRSGAPGYASLYMEGNVGPNNSDPSADNWKMAYTRIGSTNERVPLNRETFERTTPLAKYEYSITIDSIEKAESSVLQDSGASKRINEKGEWVTNRDKIDKRIISEYENGTGFIPVNEDAVGGYPTINAGTPYADSDHDGMADVWEDMYGFDKNSYSDNTQDKDGDGYTNLEEFINGTNPDSADNQTSSESDTPMIILLGANPMEINVGDTFIDPGATAQDNVDGDITASIGSSSNVDMDTAGSYHISYMVTDSDGNTATEIRSVVVSDGTSELHTLQRRVSSSVDDAEENADGDIYLNSSDLELVEDTLMQTVGMRFSGLDIPQNATITKASIQFKVDETPTASAQFVIHGENTDNASAFTSTVYNISDRTKTSASVSWSPAAWDSTGAEGEDQRTSDLTSIVHEITSKAGWSTGNAMAFILTGDGKRVAESYDGDSAGAPMLYVEYTTGEKVTPPVADTTVPEITLLGDNPMNLNAGDTFTDPGATAQDNVDGDLTVYIDISSDVNTATAGNYQVSYVVLDVAGNVAEAIRTVNVTGSIDPVDPVDPIDPDPIDPDPIDPGTTLNVPSDYSSISEALSSAVDGDTILLAPGTYNVTETIFINKKNITIASRYLTSKNENDIDATVINGVQDQHLIDGVEGESANLKVIGLTLNNAYKTITFYNSGGEVHHCKISNSRSDAISFEADANGAVTHTRVENAGDDSIDVDARKDGNFLFAYNEFINSKDDGIEVRLYNRADTTETMHYDVHDNLFSGSGEDGFQLIGYSENSNRTFDIYNNIFENISDVGIGSMYEDTTENFNGAAIPERVRIYNNYFYNNDYHITGGDNMIILNNIFEQSKYEAVKRAKGNSIIDHNLFYNNPTDTSDSVTGSHNLFANPKRNSDYTLQMDSPAIDAGTANYVHNSEAVLSILTTEYAGSSPDMGYYENSMNKEDDTLLGANTVTSIVSIMIL